MSKKQLSPEMLAALARITKGRAKIFVDHILKHGTVSTEELEILHGFTDAASAARDVKDAGIPLETKSGKRKSGRRMTIYSFGDPSKIRADRFGGRKAFPKGFKLALAARDGEQCEICGTPYELRYLQNDHRIPYQIAGDAPVGERDPAEYMLLCGSCQRAKSWSCEHCDNWREARQPEICKTCYWAYPENYTHIALQDHRRLDIVWLGEDQVRDYSALQELARQNRIALPIYAKAALAEYARRAGSRADDR